MKRYKTVAEYIEGNAHWREEVTQLSDILRSTALKETIKWGAPCYTFKGKNVVGLGAFKAYFGLWFFQGALLKDDAKVLISAQEGKTKALRQWRMQSAAEIKTAVIKRYVKEAVSLVESGTEIKADRSKPVDVPAELNAALRKQKGATALFKSLSKGRQREYAEFVASAKRDDTKQKRIAKILPMIEAGVGLNDKYRS